MRSRRSWIAAATSSRVISVGLNTHHLVAPRIFSGPERAFLNWPYNNDRRHVSPLRGSLTEEKEERSQRGFPSCHSDPLSHRRQSDKVRTVLLARLTLRLYARSRQNQVRARMRIKDHSSSATGSYRQISRKQPHHVYYTVFAELSGGEAGREKAAAYRTPYTHG